MLITLDICVLVDASVYLILIILKKPFKIKVCYIILKFFMKIYNNFCNINFYVFLHQITLTS